MCRQPARPRGALQSTAIGTPTVRVAWTRQSDGRQPPDLTGTLTVLTIESSQVDSPDEAVLDESVVGDFRRRFRRFLSHVTYYQQTGGLHEQVATAPLGGVINHGRSQ